MNNPEFDNDDNPYGKFKLHIYTNMDNLTDTSTECKPKPFKDIEVPLIRCKNTREVEWAKTGKKQYCPVFNSTHFLYGDFFTERFSWMRLVVHHCDDSLSAE